MKVFKFGGASLKNAEGVRNVANIIRSAGTNNLLVVVSAMGQTTDLTEKIHSLAHLHQNYIPALEELKQYHITIASALFPASHHVYQEIDSIITDIQSQLKSDAPFDQVYDQVVSRGEILSSIIVHHYLIQEGVLSQLADARKFIATDNTFREGKINWQKTSTNIQALKANLAEGIVLTQGFIGSTPEGFTTTLGREGSDFSAAIFASSLMAESVTIWKDVPGVMSADPKRLPGAVVFPELPFKEAAEMTFYGASVIHPKTIKPLANLGIPLYVKTFLDPAKPGTKIHECKVKQLPPLIVFKDNQCLISCKVTDYTFINEQQLTAIFHALSELDMRINLMQNSAISFSICVDFRENKVKALIQKLQTLFEVYYNTGLTLITVKNYNEKTFETFRKKDGILLEQSSRSTLQVLIRP
jgi:aspartate kinase